MTYTLTAKETAAYDGDDERLHRLMADLHDRYGFEANRAGEDVTEVYHPDGYLIANLAKIPYTLTDKETDAYDSGDDEIINRLMADLYDRYGPEANCSSPGVTKVRHPDGYTIAHLAFDAS